MKRNHRKNRNFRRKNRRIVRMNRTNIGIITAILLILTFISAGGKFGNKFTGILGIGFLIAFVFWYFTR